MMNPIDHLCYRDRPAANCNRDPRVVNAKFDHTRAMRDRCADMLANPRLVGDDRREIEMIHARAVRLLESVEQHKREFTQDRLLERLRKP